MSSAQLKPILIVTAGVVCAVVAFLISNAIFGGDDTEVSKTDNNNVICINCDHRFAMSWDDLTARSSASRSAESGQSVGGGQPGQSAPAEPPKCPNCMQPHIGFSMLRCSDNEVRRYAALTPGKQLDPAKVKALCESAEE